MDSITPDLSREEKKNIKGIEKKKVTTYHVPAGVSIHAQGVLIIHLDHAAITCICVYILDMHCVFIPVYILVFNP